MIIWNFSKNMSSKITQPADLNYSLKIILNFFQISYRKSLTRVGYYSDALTNMVRTPLFHPYLFAQGSLVKDLW